MHQKGIINKAIKLITPALLIVTFLLWWCGHSFTDGVHLLHLIVLFPHWLLGIVNLQLTFWKLTDFTSFYITSLLSNHFLSLPWCLPLTNATSLPWWWATFFSWWCGHSFTDGVHLSASFDSTFSSLIIWNCQLATDIVKAYYFIAVCTFLIITLVPTPHKCNIPFLMVWTFLHWWCAFSSFIW